MLKSLVASGLLLSVFAGAASAASLTFDNRADFLARGDTRVEHSSPAIGFTTGSIAIDDMTFTRGPGAANFGTTFNMTNLLTNELAVSGEESFNIDFGTAVFGFGMDVYDPVSTGPFQGCNVAVCLDTTFTATLKSGGSVVDTIIFDPLNSDTELGFFGVVSMTAFDRIEFLENKPSPGVNTHDNEGFGNFVSVTQVAPVPLPAAGWLLLAGFGGLAALRRKA